MQQSGHLSMKHYNIPIFVPHQGCPHQCAFCNQRTITGVKTKTQDVHRIVSEHLQTLPKHGAEIEIAFFGGSFTGIEQDFRRSLLETAYHYVKNGSVKGIRLSTRPDYISPEILEELLQFGVTTIELGVQSLDEGVLSACLRGHTAEDVYQAVAEIRKYPFLLGLQMMTGLIGDTDEKAIQTAEKIIAIKPDFVRIYPTLVLEGTLLGEYYQQGIYQPQELDAAVKLCSSLLKRFRKAKIPVIRIGLPASDELSPGSAVLAGPCHSAFGELVESELYFEKMCKIAPKTSGAVFAVAPGELSKAIGNRKRNLERYETQFLHPVQIIPDAEVEKGQIRLVNRKGVE